jgi:type IV secretory pathway VirB2 component (pilin)
MGRSTYKTSMEKLENRCKNDNLCQWNALQSNKDSRGCTGRIGSAIEDEVIAQQELNQKKIQCEKFNRDDSWGLNVASTPEDRTQAMLQRDEQCYRTEGCTMSENLDHWDQEYHAGEKIPGCTVDMGEYLGEKQLTEFNAFDTYKGPIFYGPGLRAGARIAKTKLDNTISKERSLQNLILGWTKFALSMTATLAVVALIYAGILYVTDFGQGSNKEKAQKIIQYVVTGIIVIFGSYGIVNTLMKARFGNQIGAIAYQETYEAENFALKI